MRARPWGCRKQGAGLGPGAGPKGCREPSGRPSWRGAEGLWPNPPHPDPPAARTSGDPFTLREGQGAVCAPDCRRLYAERSVAGS